MAHESTSLSLTGLSNQTQTETVTVTETVTAEPAETTTASSVNLSVAKALFPDVPQRNLDTYFPPVMQALADYQLNDPRFALMALATIRVETAAFLPISEYKSKYNTSPGGTPFDLYDTRKDLGNLGAPDGDSFKGRGFIQLTGRSNYTQYSRLLGLDDQLLQNPELANDPVIAARILALFIKNKESRILTALNEQNYRTARRLVNGGSHGLSQFTQAYQTGASLLGLPY